MAKKISQLAEDTTLTGTELVPMLDGVTNKRTTVAAIREKFVAAKARINDDGELQLWNLDDGTWHSIELRREDDELQIKFKD